MHHNDAILRLRLQVTQQRLAEVAPARPRLRTGRLRGARERATSWFRAPVARRAAAPTVQPRTESTPFGAC